MRACSFFTTIINCIDGWNRVKTDASRHYAELMDRLTLELRRKVAEWIVCGSKGNMVKSTNK